MPGKSKYQRRNERRRQMAFNILGRKCVRCGSTENLQFDHKNPEEKTAKLSRFWSAEEHVFIREVLKCQVLCKKCHDKKTKNDVTINAKHGSASMWQKGCRCKICAEKRVERLTFYGGER
jgi:5-methylcytosine-specific restriction endonuclease McrA